MSHAPAGPCVIPCPATPPLGTGAARALVPGGGGEYFAAWMAGYLHTFDTAGVDVSNADVVVGTSAGSLVGSALTGGHLRRLTAEFDLFAHVPSLLEKLAHQAPPTASQQRALASCSPPPKPIRNTSGNSVAWPWPRATPRFGNCGRASA